MEASKALADIQLLGTKLHRLEFSNDFITYYDSEDVKKVLDVSYKVIETYYDDEERIYVGTLNLYVDVDITCGEDEKMTMQMELQGGFASLPTKEQAEEAFAKLLEINGTAALYSIARSIVLSLTSQSYAGEAVMLPMINVFRLRKE